MLSNELPTLSQIFRKLREENYSSAFCSWKSGLVSMSFLLIVSCKDTNSHSNNHIKQGPTERQVYRTMWNWVTMTDLNRSLACFPLIQEKRVKFFLSNFDDRRAHYSYFLMATYFSRWWDLTSFIGQKWNWCTKNIQWTILMVSKYKTILTSDTYVIISMCIDISLNKFENLINKSKEVKSCNCQCTYNC